MKKASMFFSRSLMDAVRKEPGLAIQFANAADLFQRVVAYLGTGRDCEFERIFHFWSPFGNTGPSVHTEFRKLLEDGFSGAHRIEAYFHVFPGRKLGFTLSSYVRGEKETHDQFDFHLE